MPPVRNGGEISGVGEYNNRLCITKIWIPQELFERPGGYQVQVDVSARGGQLECSADRPSEHIRGTTQLMMHKKSAA